MLTKQLPPFGYGETHVSVTHKKVVDFYFFKINISKHYLMDLQIYCVFPV